MESLKCSALTLLGKKCTKRVTCEDGTCTQHTKHTCSICLEPLKASKVLSTCHHKFHIECINEWFLEQETCPVCRSDQVMDQMVQFRMAVEERMRLKYRDAIRSLEEELRVRRT
jgi:hypothetical protein